MSVDDFQGHTAVVTGAASGIGFALAERFVARAITTDDFYVFTHPEMTPRSKPGCRPSFAARTRS